MSVRVAVAPRGSAGATSGWWNLYGGIDCFAAYQPKGAANLAASYTDLSGNGKNAGLGVAPTWDAVNGWKFNGLTQYLTTTFVPQNDQSQTMIVQFTNFTSAPFGALCGRWHPTLLQLFALFPNYYTFKLYANGATSFAAPNIGAGNMAVAGNQGYVNGMPSGEAIGNYNSVPYTPVFIGGVNQAGSLYAPGAAYIQAFALYDCTLIALEVSALYAAIQAEVMS